MDYIEAKHGDLKPLGLVESKILQAIIHLRALKAYTSGTVEDEISKQIAYWENALSDLSPNKKDR